MPIIAALGSPPPLPESALALSCVWSSELPVGLAALSVWSDPPGWVASAGGFSSFPVPSEVPAAELSDEAGAPVGEGPLSLDDAAFPAPIGTGITPEFPVCSGGTDVDGAGLSLLWKLICIMGANMLKAVMDPVGTASGATCPSFFPAHVATDTDVEVATMAHV